MSLNTISWGRNRLMQRSGVAIAAIPEDFAGPLIPDV